ncbi:MAG: DNA primase [Burkholderiales bacterium]|nr:DNA primase [Anaerolineae bacterium]
MSVVDDIKAQLDIVAYIQQYTPLKKAGRNYKAPCPFHGERTPSFYVNPDNQSWRCFGACSEGGDIFSFAMKRHGWTFTEALEELGKQAGIEVKPRSPVQAAQDEKLDKLRGLLQTAAESYHACLIEGTAEGSADVLNYAREKRGLTDETIIAFGVGYAPPGWSNMRDHLAALGYSDDDIIEAGMATRSDNGRVYDRFRNRLIIPIRDGRGRVIAFGARALAPDDEPKYLNSPQTPIFDKSSTLFALDVARKAIRDTASVVIVEGYMDAIQAHQAGYTNVVAQMGTAMTEQQLKLIAPLLANSERGSGRIIMALDADAAGQNATRRSLEVARQSLEADFAGRLSADIRILQIPGAKDPDDFLRESPEGWQALVDNAQPVADYVIDAEMAALPANPSVHEREALARRLLPMLVASENDLYRKDNIQRLALRLHIAERDLLSWAEEQRRINTAKAPRPYNRPPERPNSGAQRPTWSSPPVMDEPPEFAPTNYDDLIPPLDYDEDGGNSFYDLPVRGAVRNGRWGTQKSTPEEYCLRVLFEQPKLMYAINRQFRELAADYPALMSGPLCDVDVSDFSRSDYCALLQAFQDAIEQDEYEPLDFLRANLDSTLLAILDEIMVDDLQDVRSRLRYRMNGEVADYWKTHHKSAIAVVDRSAEFVDRMLDLRLKRIRRELQEITFLAQEAQASGDSEAAKRYLILAEQSIHAKTLVEREQKRRREGSRP